MTCARARELIVKLDAHEAPGPRLAHHLDDCEACSKLYDRLQRVETSAALGPEASPPTTGEPLPTSTDFTARVMRAVSAESRAARSPACADAPAPAEPPDQRPVGLRGWTVGATIILAGVVAIEFSDAVAWLRCEFGSVIDVALGTMLGVALTVYILLLVGSNLRAVLRLLRPRIR